MPSAADGPSPRYCRSSAGVESIMDRPKPPVEVTVGSDKQLEELIVYRPMDYSMLPNFAV